MNILSDSQIDVLIRAFTRGMPEGFTKVQTQRWLDWCIEVKVRAALLHLILQGSGAVAWKEGEAEPKF